MKSSSGDNSGDGSRPTTDGATDNIGAGGKFTGSHSKAGDDVSAPGPAEGMAAKRKTADSAGHEDSDAFHLHEDLTPETNTDAGAADKS
ncbi:hypothetical protein [Variovorax sp. KK3]|uniref:hypothetical protein n=1 Tax=Variovorax sp. KK3 TaxID=1855728 RepID=UPI00097C9BD0|nr:hypothetical protein [Variovorax sp. KK3]